MSTHRTTDVVIIGGGVISCLAALTDPCKSTP
jgi:succinate dehydrogenase/fumarate reductase flavoprotein subunit